MQTGYNWQLGLWLAGVEKMDIAFSTQRVITSQRPGAICNAAFRTPVTVVDSHSLDWVGTVCGGRRRLRRAVRNRTRRGGGSEMPRDLPVPGRELAGIHYAMEFLPQQNKINAGDKVKDQMLALGPSMWW